MWSFVTSFFHLAWYSQDSSMLVHRWVLNFSSLPNNSLLYGCTKFFYPFISWWTFGLFQLWGIYEQYYGASRSDGKESACNMGDLGSIPGSGRSPGEGNGNPLQYSCLENLMDREAGWSTVHRVAQSRTWVKGLSRMNSTVLKIYVQVCVWTYGFVSLGYIHRSAIARSYGNSMFNILRNCQTAFRSSWNILYFHQQCTRVLSILANTWYYLAFDHSPSSELSWCLIVVFRLPND